MEENKFEWMMNSSLDQVQSPFPYSNAFHDSFSGDCCTNFPNIIPPQRNISISRDQFSFLQGTVEENARNNSWNCHNNSKPIDLQFGGSANLSSPSYDLKERHEEFGKGQQGIEIVSKVPVQMHGQDHIIAERKRREKLNQRFVELSSVIPSLKKMDKASILVDAVVHIKELQQKVKNLEAQNLKPIESVVLVKNSCKAGDPGCSSSTKSKLLPEIEVRLSGNKILISIHCESFKGVLVKVLSELEERNITVTHANQMPLSRSTSFITLHAQVEEASNITAEDVVRLLNSALLIKIKNTRLPKITLPSLILFHREKLFTAFLFFSEKYFSTFLCPTQTATSIFILLPTNLYLEITSDLIQKNLTTDL